MSEREIVHLTEEERQWCRENFNFVLMMGGNYRVIDAPKKRKCNIDAKVKETE